MPDVSRGSSAGKTSRYYAQYLLLLTLCDTIGCKSDHLHVCVHRHTVHTMVSCDKTVSVHSEQCLLCMSVCPRMCEVCSTSLDQRSVVLCDLHDYMYMYIYRT